MGKKHKKHLKRTSGGNVKVAGGVTTVDIHGSCVSRNIFNAEETPDIKTVQFFSRNNIVSCMMPPLSVEYMTEQLVHNSEYARRCVQYSLDKSTVSRLLNSDSDFLVVDFFDMCQHVAVSGNTTFSTYDYTMTRVDGISKIIEGQVNFLELPKFFWYSYVDIYWDTMVDKFGSNIVLVRLSCCDRYMRASGGVTPLPERVLGFGNRIYNNALAELEDWIEENYRKSAYAIMEHIIRDRPEQRYFDNLPPEITAHLLDRQVSPADFKNLLHDYAKPFCSCEFLDSLCILLSDDEIVENRFWLARLYRDFPKRLESVAVENYINAISPSDAFQRAFAERLRERLHKHFSKD
ncbi:hypothetical protein FACS189499_07510 [Clostridia bacterium]|nr:hypothetical protein FACS189499_07510 [Clostridia bacterium]